MQINKAGFRVLRKQGISMSATCLLMLVEEGVIDGNQQAFYLHASRRQIQNKTKRKQER